jgi:hypothetical protein
MERAWDYIVWGTFGALCLAALSIWAIALFSHSYVAATAP